ncbi:hypothetical protein BDV18DRAFT_155964 [Aspergillus unguis]
MPLPIPDRSARAPAIRHFITQLLISEYDTDPASASEIARAWQIGRGAELHDAKLGYFQHVFGPEIGFCLFRSVLEARDIAWLDSRVGRGFNFNASHRVSLPIARLGRVDFRQDAVSSLISAFGLWCASHGLCVPAAEE